MHSETTSYSAQDRAHLLVAQIRALAHTATILENRGDKDTYQKIVDLMIELEDEYYYAGHDLELYFAAQQGGAR